MTDRSKRVCPVEEAAKLETLFRKVIHNPKRILRDYVKEGMVVLDVGCGPGLFSVEMAKMVGELGKVIATDLQEGMLEKLKQKIRGKEIEKRITLHKCNKNNIGISEKVDFVLAFFVLHEIPNQQSFLMEMKSILKQNGQLLLIEPKFHVSKQDFKESVRKAIDIGFKVVKKPRIFFSRAVVLEGMK